MHYSIDTCMERLRSSFDKAQDERLVLATTRWW
jgi:hypothetical protein